MNMTETLLKYSKRTIKSSAAPFSRMLASRRWQFNQRGASAAQVLIVGYHRIVADIARAERETINGLVTSTETFRRHLLILREHYDVMTLDAATEVLRGTRLARRAVAVITFDDGYRDMYDQAFPVLQELGLPATVFVPTAGINTGQALDHDLLYSLVLKARARGLSLHVPLVKGGMSLDQAATLCAEVSPERLSNYLVHLPLALRENVLYCLRDFLDEQETHLKGFDLLDWEMMRKMARAGIDFGAHTDNHAVLTLETEATIEREILRNKLVLEKQLGRRMRHFAYPTGEYNDVVKRVLKRLGFDVAVTTKRQLNQRGADLLALGRVCLCEESTRGITGRYSEAVARLRLAA
jgi:peptidoglycan/xylan/chitin deacetylase (PgdA/CDA1 family)